MTIEEVVLNTGQEHAAQLWYLKHTDHVLRIIQGVRYAYPPSGEDRGQPYLWKPANWVWYLDRFARGLH